MSQVSQYFTPSSTGSILGAFYRLIVLQINSSHNLQSFPDLQPLYDAARSYLEIPQRINLLNTRVEVRALASGAASSIC